MRAEVDKLVADLLALTRTTTTQLNSSAGLGSSFLGRASFTAVAPPVHVPVSQGMVTSTEIARLTAMVEDVKQLVNGGGFKTQSQDFKSYQDVVVFCKKSLPASLCYQCFPDIGTMLSNGNSGFANRSDIEQRELHGSKVGRTTPQSDVVASFQSQDPEIFGNNYSNLKTFNDWDGGDGVEGVYNTISIGMEDWMSSLSTSIDHTFEMHPAALSVCKELLSLTVDFFRKMSSMMSILYRELMVTTFGSDNPSKESKAICWKIVLTLVRVIFRELRKVRVGSEHAYNFPHRANALYLWGILQAHRVMAEFVKTNFREHPMFHPKMIMFLFETSVPKSEIDRVIALVHSVRALPTTVDTITRNINSVKGRMDSFEDRLAALERAGGGGGYGGGGGGGQSAAAKRKAEQKRKREAAARGGCNSDIEDIP